MGVYVVLRVFFLAISSIPLSSVVPDTHFGRVFHLSYGLQEMKDVRKFHTMRLPRTSRMAFRWPWQDAGPVYAECTIIILDQSKRKKRAVRSIRAVFVANTLWPRSC